MAIQIKSVKGYYFLDAWIMANIIQQSTLHFCNDLLTRENDPCGRLRDQMTMAARSAVANIAEGASRRQTSRETEMRLTDVARASLSELLCDFYSYALYHHIRPWEKASREYTLFNSLQLDHPDYGSDIEAEAYDHICRQFAKFERALLNQSTDIRVNANMLLINRCIHMLNKMIQRQLDDFSHEGGFSENLTKLRRATVQEDAAQSDAPKCPKCGSPMQQRMVKRGSRQGSSFWGCCRYPECDGTLN